MLSRLSRFRLFVTPWTVARQAPLFMEFSRQEYWGGLPCFPEGDSSQPRNRTQVSCIAWGFFTAKPPGKPRQIIVIVTIKLITHVEV